MDSGEKMPGNGEKWRVFGCGQVVYGRWENCAKVRGFAPIAIGWWSRAVHKMCSVPQPCTGIFAAFPLLIRRLFWDLCIQFSFDARDGGADVGVQVCFFFDFFYRVDGGGVVFAAEFAGDFGEAEF